MKPKRWLIYVLAVASANLALLAPMIASAPSASALCTYPSGYEATQYYGGTLVAREDPAYGGTCDFDTYYAGSINDPVTDGSCAYAWFSDNAGGYFATQGVECTTGGWAGYSYRDVDGDYFSNVSVGTSYTASGWYLNQYY